MSQCDMTKYSCSLRSLAFVSVFCNTKRIMFVNDLTVQATTACWTRVMSGNLFLFSLRSEIILCWWSDYQSDQFTSKADSTRFSAAGQRHYSFTIWPHVSRWKTHIYDITAINLPVKLQCSMSQTLLVHSETHFWN